MIPSSVSHDVVRETGRIHALGKLDRFATPFAGSNPDAVVHWQNEDLSVANFTAFAAAATFQDCINGWLNELFVDADLQLHLA